MQKDTAGQYFHVIAFNNNGRVTGNAANMTCELSIDDAARGATNDVNPTEIGTTGEYRYTLTQAETNGYALSFSPVSTGGTQCMGVPSNLIFTTDPSGPTYVIPQSVIEQAAVPEGTDVVYQASQWTITLEGIPDDEYTNTDYVYFGIKSQDGPDSESALQVKWTKSGDTTVVTYVNGAPAAGAQITDANVTHSTYDPGDASTAHRYILVIEGETTAEVPTTDSLNGETRLGDISVYSRSRYGYSSEWKITGTTDLVIGAGYLVVRPSVVRTTN